MKSVKKYLLLSFLFFSVQVFGQENVEYRKNYFFYNGGFSTKSIIGYGLGYNYKSVQVSLSGYKIPNSAYSAQAKYRLILKDEKFYLCFGLDYTQKTIRVPIAWSSGNKIFSSPTDWDVVVLKSLSPLLEVVFYIKPQYSLFINYAANFPRYETQNFMDKYNFMNPLYISIGSQIDFSKIKKR
jgi:hypothetical protein